MHTPAKKSKKERRPAAKSPRPRPATAAQPAAAHPAHPLLELQQTIGNRAVQHLLEAGSAGFQVRGSDLAVLRQETAEPTRTKPASVKIPIAPDKAVVFKTATVTLGKVKVHVTGRMAIEGKASLIGEELPKKNPGAALQKRVRELTKSAFDGVKPTGNETKIELALGGETLALELNPGAENGPEFQVSGHFTAKKKEIKVSSCEVSGASITMDATVWIAPAAPPTPAPAGTASTPGDASVKGYSFAGDAAKFSGKSRSASVSLKSAMDDFEAKVPSFVKDHDMLRLPEQRAAFFQHMRAYFGTDAKTIEHFAKLRKANVKGATTWLHDEAATRLEQVQAEIGEANMPSSGGVGWPRSEATMQSEQTIGNLHNIGFAVDYNAYQTPHIKERKILDLIQIVTGRSPSATYSAPAGMDTRKIGETFTGGTEEEKTKLAADPKIQKWLEGVGKEAESLSKASEDFRASLKSKDAAGAEVDLAPKLQELRAKWFAAKTPADKEKVMAELPAVLKPWLDKVGAQRTAMEKKIKDAGLDPAKLPADKELDKAIKDTDRIHGQMKALEGKLGATLKKGQRAQVDKLVAEGRKLLGETGEAAADDAAAVTELKRLIGLLEKRQPALGQKKWLDRVNALDAALKGDPSLVFGKKADKAVSDPALAQLVDTGFFTLKGKPKAGKEAFDVDFVKSMVKHGFTHGGTWSTPDYMHFELRWKGPGGG